MNLRIVGFLTGLTNFLGGGTNWYSIFFSLTRQNPMEETAMVKSNDFEVLLEKIAEENAAIKRKKLDDDNLRSIQKSIISVHYFLRIQCGMPQRPLTPEEYKIAENKLREFAQNEVKKPRRRFWLIFGTKSRW